MGASRRKRKARKKALTGQAAADKGRESGVGGGEGAAKDDAPRSMIIKRGKVGFKVQALVENMVLLQLILLPRPPLPLPPPPPSPHHTHTSPQCSALSNTHHKNSLPPPLKPRHSTYTPMPTPSPKRTVMSPNTALKLKESKKNSLKVTLLSCSIMRFATSHS